MPNHRMTPTSLLGLLLMSLLIIDGCQSEKSARDKDARLRVWRGEHAVASRKPWHEKLAPDALASDPAMFDRIITMTAAEAGKRLGSYKHNVAAKFSFNQSARRYAQDNLITVHQDSSANMHVTQDTKQERAELYLVDDTLYVKLDNGPFRHKPALNQPIALWREMASRTTTEAVDLLRPFMKFEGPELASFGNRTVYRYTIRLDDERVAAVPKQQADAGSDDTRTWRDRLRPTGIRGELIVDRATGVVLRLEIKTRADILDRPVQATSMRLHLLSELSAIGTAGAVTPPAESIPEHQRIRIDRGDQRFIDGLTDH